MSINFNNPIPDIVYINGNSYSPYDFGFPMDLEPMSQEYSNTHTITQNGNYIVLSDTDRYLTQLDLSVNVPGGLTGQEKSITIPADTTTITSVTPDTGYNALTKLNVQISDIVINKYDSISINNNIIDSTTYSQYLNPDPTQPKILEIGYQLKNGYLYLNYFLYRDDFDGYTKSGYLYIDASFPNIVIRMNYNSIYDDYILPRPDNRHLAFNDTLILN